jgi:hypothetical protein
MVLIVVGISIVLLIGMVIWLRRSSITKKLKSPDKAERRSAWIRFSLVLTAIILFPLVTLVGSVFADEWLNYERIEARVEGTERVCTVATRSPRKGRDRWNDQTEPFPCDQAPAQRARFGGDTRIVEKERITYVYGGSGGEGRGYVIWSDPPSPFRAGQAISVLHPKSGEGAGRRPTAL